MFKFSLSRFAFLAFLFVTLSIPGFAQLCGGIYGPCPPASTTSTSTAPPATMPSTTSPSAPATSISTAPATTATPATTTVATTAPATTAAATTAPATATPTTPAVTTTSTSSSVAPGTSQVTLSSIPGYNAGTSYSAGKTVAYVIAPFAVVAGTYFLGHHHQIEINHHSR